MRLSPLRRFVLVVVLLGLLTSITSAMGRPVLAATTTTLPLAAMPMISRNVPAYATNAVLPASNGNAADYGLAYRGTLPTSLSYDLSGVAAAQRTKLLVSWSNDGNIWYPPMISAAYANNPRDYTLDANAAAGGGSPPATGWVNLVTMTGNAYNGRQHAVDFTGYSWLRMQVTAVNGSAGNTDASFKLDAYDASAGTADTWTFFGDSITQSDMKHADPAYADGLHNFAQLVNAAHPPNFPSFLDGGISGKLASSMLQTDPATGTVYWTEFLAATASRFVSIDFGTNDANQGVAPSTFRSQMQQLISAAETAGKVPVIRLIPWGCSSGIQSNAPLLNQQIQALWAADSQIIHGPDLWTYFSQHQNLISSDCIHPTLPDGALAYRQQYEQTMLAAVYSALQVTGLQTGNVGPSSALINWQTNNGANSRVDYGTTTGYGLSVSDGSSLTAHSVTLPTLNSNTTYHYKSTSLDGFGQTATSADATFTTTSGWGWARGVGGADAAISGGSYTLSVTAPAAGNFLALSSVLVDVNKAGTPSIASVRDNGSPASSWARAVANTDGGLHDSGEIWYAANVTGRPTQITVTVNLAGSSNPHQASRVDEYAGIATSAPLDQTAIRTNNNVAVSPTGTTGATGVDQELAIALYGDNNQGLTITSPAGWTERRNSVGRSGAGEAVIDKAVPLGPQTASFSTNGNTWAVAAIATFKIATGPPPPPPPLQVTGVQTGNVGPTSAVISWQTNNPANSRVDYGLTTTYGQFVSDGTSVIAHSLTLSNLTTLTTYHYMVTSVDGAGQTASSADGTFTTISTPRGWAWAQGASGADAAVSGGSYTLSIAAPAAGNFLALSSVLVDVNKVGTPTIASVRDNGSPASTWARAVANTDGGLHDSAEIWYATNVTGRPTQITVTVNVSGSTNLHQASRADEYSGIAGSAPLDQTAIHSDYNVAVSPTGTTAATAADQELAIALYGDNNQGLTITSPYGWTERRNSLGRYGAGEVVIDRAVPIGPQTASFSTNGYTWAVTAIATFKLQP